MGKKKRLILIGLALCVLTALFLVMRSSSFYDRSNPRNRPNSYLTQVSVEINKPVHDVYLFVKYRKPEVYSQLSDMHNQFKIINAEGLTEGAIVECIEGDEEDIVHHRYIVRKDIEDTLIYYDSTPSIIYDTETNKKIGECNTHVYYDFIRLDGHRTLLNQTIIIDMLNPLYKTIGDIIGWMSGDKEKWTVQFQEELEALKRCIEK